MSINRKTLRAEIVELKRCLKDARTAADAGGTDALRAAKRAADAETELASVIERHDRASRAAETLGGEVQMLRTDLARIEGRLEWLGTDRAISAHGLWALREIIAGALNLKPATDLSLEAFQRSLPPASAPASATPPEAAPPQ